MSNGTIEGKPRGWSKYLLAIDCETTGIAIRCDDPSYNPDTNEEYQAIAWGLAVVDSTDLGVKEQMYLTVEWDRKSVWCEEAEKVHGLSRSYLAEHGFNCEEACQAIGSLIMKYWGPENPIILIGHNVYFDKCFLQRLFRKFDIELHFGNRHVDTSSIGFACWSTWNSDDLFELVGANTREKHNALEDALLCVQVIKTTRTVFERCLDGD